MRKSLALSVRALSNKMNINNINDNNNNNDDDDDDDDCASGR